MAQGMEQSMESKESAHEPARKFAWENWSAFVDGQLEPEQARRIEEYLKQCPDTAAFMASQRQFDAACRKGLAESNCPEGMRERIQAALDRCEDPGALAPVIRFPWLSLGALAAASLMLALSLLLVFSPREDAVDSAELLRERLGPMVTQVSFEVPKAEKCRYRAANEQYRQWFADGPDLPRTFEGTQCRISSHEIAEFNSRKVMCVLYDDPNGERFALIIFRCRRTADLLPEFLDAAEMDISGRHVQLWREQNYVRALVSLGSTTALRRRANGLRPAA
jgi:hypothetical protein